MSEKRVREKRQLDYPGKKHLIITCDEHDNPVYYEWLTTREQRMISRQQEGNK